MKQIRWILFPFALLYGLAVRIRNSLYNRRIKSSYEIPIPSIVVGNLSAGGTGKSPLVAYLIDFFLENDRKLATLSRGYGRSTKGFVSADQKSTALEIGDEPLQYFNRFGQSIQVAVAESRQIGVESIIQSNSAIDLILLDDAFQHRAVTGGLNILVTEFERPFTQDFLLPVGMLREPKSGAHRADIIVVSKCPETATESDKKQRRSELEKYGKPIFLSSIKYDKLELISGPVVSDYKHILLVTGIGNPEPLKRYMKTLGTVTHLKFPDHHSFTEKDIATIHQKFNTFASHDTIIVTTEKDYMRLQTLNAITQGKFPWYYQPIAILFEEEEKFKKLLNNYVGKV